MKHLERLSLIIDENLGSRIREIRKERGISQSAFADALGISQGVVSKIERAQIRNPGVPVANYVKALGVTASRILSDVKQIESARLT
jgi:transcriptional regulator with XRE-family HTH domain